MRESARSHGTMPPTRILTLLALALALPRGAPDALAAHAPSLAATAAAPAAPLVRRLDGLVASPVFHPTETGIALVALPEGRTIYAHNAARLLRPASTLKII